MQIKNSNIEDIDKILGSIKLHHLIKNQRRKLLFGQVLKEVW